jgi:hypothetical protein
MQFSDRARGSDAYITVSGYMNLRLGCGEQKRESDDGEKCFGDDQRFFHDEFKNLR